MLDPKVFFREDAVKEAKRLVLRCHYSHRFTMATSYCGTWHLPGGLFGDYGRIIAACVFLPPVGGTSESLFRKTPMLELKRLVREENVDCPPLTKLIAQCCDRIKDLKLADLLISYADIEQDHHGGIYQAASWNYSGVRNSQGNYLLINGQKRGTRGLVNQYGTRAIGNIRKRMPSATVETYNDAGKHFYWRSLTKTGKKQAEALGFKSLPYPKPQNIQIKDAS